MKLFRILISIAIVFVLIMTSSCSNRGKSIAQTLTDDQKAVCAFITDLFGNPDDEFYSIEDESRWEEYLSKNDRVFGEGGLLASHCSESLVQSIESQLGRNLWGQYLGGEDIDGMSRYYNAFRNVFLIVVDNDWYTYYAFYNGNFCSHTIHATLSDGEVLIDDIDVSGDYNMTWGFGDGASLRTTKWLMGAWVSQEENKYYLFENYGRCNLLELQQNLDPIILSFKYNTRNNRVTLFSDSANTTSTFSFEKQQDSLLVADGDVFRKVLGAPIILIKSNQ